MEEQIPIIVNYEPKSIDGYLIGFDSSMPKFQNFIADI